MTEPGGLRSMVWRLAALCLPVFLFYGCGAPESTPPALVLRNASYDASRELYRELNAAFSSDWKQRFGQEVEILMSHAGSGKQARAVMDGLPADVVSLALAWDVDIISSRGKLIRPDWQQQFPNDSCPYTTTVVFLVRAGNPKGIHDWPDLVRPGISVLTPNPKTSGGARWNYLAAWAWAMRANGGDEAAARAFMRNLFANVRVLNVAARGSMTTLVRTGEGDVLLAWENEARLAMAEVGAGRFEIVYPSLSIRAEPPVAIVDAGVDQRGTRELATEYIRFLYSLHGQEIIARHYLRPLLDQVAAEYAERFPAISTVRITDFYRSWDEAQKIHFSDGGIYDQIVPGGRPDGGDR